MESKKDYILTTGKRKTAIARVWLKQKGNGKITVNGKPIADYFPYFQWQDIVQAPTKLTSTQANDITVKVVGGGIRAQADAIANAIAKALLKIDETLKPALRGSGLLTRDSRKKERKKPGLKRARRAPQFSKR